MHKVVVLMLRGLKLGGTYWRRNKEPAEETKFEKTLAKPFICALFLLHKIERTFKMPRH